MRVALFITCLVDGLFPDVGKATVRLLRRLGHDVEVPLQQTCCGQMHINTGYPREALPLVRNHVETFLDYDAIVAPSGSCTGSIRHQHVDVAREFGDDALAEGARLVASHTYELSEFLVDVLGVTDVGAYFPHRVTYHPTCHSLRLLRVGDRPLRLLREVRGLDLVELPDAESCCGFGGTFALKNPDVSTAMLADKMSNVLDTRAEVCSAGDSSCLMHIGGGLSRLHTGVRTVHLAESAGIVMTTPTRPGRCRQPARAPALSGGRPRSRRGRAATPQSRQCHGDDPREACSCGRPSCPTGHSCARPARPSRTTCWRISTGTWCNSSSGSPSVAAPCTGPATRTTPTASSPSSSAAQARRGGKGQVDGHPGNRPERGTCRRRHRRLGDRPRRVDRAVRSRPAQPHPRAGDSSQPSRDPRDLPARDGRRRPIAHRRTGALAEAARSHLRRKFLAASVAISGANFAVAETGTLARGRVRGQRADVPDVAPHAHHGHGHREARPHLARPRGVPATAPPVVDRRADEPVYVDVDGRRRGPDTSTSSCSTTAEPRRWPTHAGVQHFGASAARPA